MTFEEMTDKYAEKVVKHKMAVHDIFNEIVTKKEIKEAVMYGLKAGKDMNVLTEWHDLRKDPTDVPKENVTVLLLTEVEPVTARYDNKYEAFFRLSDKLDYCVFIAPMSYIAWCEISTYTED